MSKTQSAKQAKDYLEKENYYQKNSEMGYFRGEGLKHLGLENNTPVTSDMYVNLLYGFNPTTGEKLHKNSGDEGRRAGFDVTFSAPKSVSVLMEAVEANGLKEAGKLLREAHERAVKIAMEKIEKNFSKTRIYDAKGKRIKVTAEMVYATFQHDTARMVNKEIDPQLHSHNFIMSTCFYTDPETGEVKSLALSNEEIYRNKMYLGQTYRSEYAKILSELGYEIEVTNVAQGFFDIKGFSQEQLDEFSGRSKQMRSFLPEYREKFPSMSEAKLLEIIGQEKKSKKIVIDREELLERNKERLENVGIDKQFVLDFVSLRPEIQPKITPELMQNHINKVSKTLTDKQSVFSKEAFMLEALKYGLEHSLTEKDYMKALSEDDNIIKLDDNVYSTQAMIEAEMSVIEAVHNGKNTQESYQVNTDEAEKFIEEKYSSLTDGQKEMYRHILTSKDQIIAIQGDAGTGKTYAMKGIKEFLNVHNGDVKIEGIVFTGRATSGLQKDSGIKSQTIHSYLAKAKNKKDQDKRPRLIVVDEAGMIGSFQADEIIKTLRPQDKIIFMGDTKQFKSISAGRMFADMQKYGISTTYLDEAKRQEEGYAKEAVTLLKDQEVEQSLSRIEKEGKYVELDRDDMIFEVAEHYADLTEKQRRETLILSSTNADRREANSLIRENLGMGGDYYTIKENLNFQGIKAHFNTHYEEGLFLAIQGGKIDGFQNGQQLVITGKKEGSDKIIIVQPLNGGKERELNVFEQGDKLQVYQEVQKSFQKGDCITFTKNTTLDKKTRTEVKNGDRDYIKSINKKGDVVMESGKNFNINDMNYLDHGYVVTDVKSQGASIKSVIVMANSQMASFNAFYTQITRAEAEIMVFTDSKEKLEANIKKDQEDKSTLDYLLNQDGTRKDQTQQKGKDNGRSISEIERDGRETGSKTQRDREVTETDGRSRNSTTERESNDILTSDEALRGRRRARGKSTYRATGRVITSDRRLIDTINEAILKLETVIKEADKMIADRITKEKAKSEVVITSLPKEKATEIALSKLPKEFEFKRATSEEIKENRMERGRELTEGREKSQDKKDIVKQAHDRNTEAREKNKGKEKNKGDVIEL